MAKKKPRPFSALQERIGTAKGQKLVKRAKKNKRPTAAKQK